MMRWTFNDVEVDALKDLVSESLKYLSDDGEVKEVGERIVNQLINADPWVIVDVYVGKDTDFGVEKWELNKAEIGILKDLVSAGIEYLSNSREVKEVGQKILNELDDENVKIDIYPMPF